MTSESKSVIIKRVKRIEAGHHGGAWKVAYADFVTAMMAFFLLLWLLGSTTEEQRQGIADYFSPNLVAFPTSATGGDGPFDGSSMFSEESLTDDALGPEGIKSNGSSTDQEFWEIEDELLSGSGDATEADPLLRHVRTRITDEGLIIEIFDIAGSPLFHPTTNEPAPVLHRLVGMIGRVIGRTANPVAVTGHVGSVLAGTDPWVRSTTRAQDVRQWLVKAGVDEFRIARVTGKADRDPAVDELTDPRNHRIEITLLRRFGPAKPR